METDSDVEKYGLDIKSLLWRSPDRDLQASRGSRYRDTDSGAVGQQHGPAEGRQGRNIAGTSHRVYAALCSRALAGRYDSVDLEGQAGMTRTILGFGRRVRRALKRVGSIEFGARGENVEVENGFRGYGLENIQLGSDIYLGYECTLFGYGGIKIGDGSILGHRVEIQTRNHNYDSDDLLAIPYDSRYIHKPVTIGRFVWVGSNVLIVPGVKIGDGAVIAMGSVVTRDVPERAVVGGNPASIIRYRDRARYEELADSGMVYMRLSRGRGRSPMPGYFA